ncbi:hypothetical protein GCM10027189_13070 [Rufibacter soli]
MVIPLPPSKGDEEEGNAQGVCDTALQNKRAFLRSFGFINPEKRAQDKTVTQL